MSVMYENTGERHRRFDEAIQFMEAYQFEDSPVRGPATVLWCVKFMRTNGGSPLGWHQRWMTITKLQPSDPYAAFHECNCRILELAVTYDQLGVTALASMEYVCRQIQMIEEKYKDKNTSTSSESFEASLYAGVTHRSGLCISPQLSAWISDELKGEAAVMKERRKAREERALARPKNAAKES